MTDRSANGETTMEARLPPQTRTPANTRAGWRCKWGSGSRPSKRCSVRSLWVSRR